MLQLFESLAFDLANALSRDLEDSAGFLQRIAIAISQSVTQFDDFTFAVGQALKDVIDLITQHLLGS